MVLSVISILSRYLKRTENHMALHYLQTKVNPVGKDETRPALSITPTLRKGQKNNPIKNMDIPMEIRQPLRKGNSRQLARAMQTAGGAMSVNGRPYAAVLEERGVNPNLATTNVPLAKQTPNDLYKRANLLKLAEYMYNQPYPQQPSTQMPPPQPSLTDKMTSSAKGAIIGTGLGIAAGLTPMGKFLGGMRGATAVGQIGGGILGWKNAQAPQQQQLPQPVNPGLNYGQQ
jgi:hypothetical protein